VPEMKEARCKHCRQSIIAFLPGMRLWYLKNKPWSEPQPARRSFGKDRPPVTQEDIDSYKPWNDQRRTVGCAASPTQRHAPEDTEP
jgi:hypothetical protein